MKKTFYIQKYALWQQTENEPVPDVSFVPPLVRRRLNTVEKIGLYLAREMGPFVRHCQLVFASRFGEWQQTINLIDQMYREGEMSPAGFSHSVHNAMPGLLTELNRTHLSYTAVSAGPATIENGLIETLVSCKPVVFIYAEEQTPDFYAPKFGTPITGQGVGFILTASKKNSVQEIRVADDKNRSDKNTTFEDLCDFLQNDRPLLTNGLVWKRHR